MKDQPNDQNEDIRKLMTAISSLQRQMIVFEGELQWKYDQQIDTLRGLIRQCNYLLYLSIKLCCDQQKGAPEDL